MVAAIFISVFFYFWKYILLKNFLRILALPSFLLKSKTAPGWKKLNLFNIIKGVLEKLVIYFNFLVGVVPNPVLVTSAFLKGFKISFKANLIWLNSVTSFWKDADRFISPAEKSDQPRKYSCLSFSRKWSSEMKRTYESYDIGFS